MRDIRCSWCELQPRSRGGYPGGCCAASHNYLLSSFFSLFAVRLQLALQCHSVLQPFLCAFVAVVPPEWFWQHVWCAPGASTLLPGFKSH
jgi:hypothetical protein